MFATINLQQGPTTNPDLLTTELMDIEGIEGIEGQRWDYCETTLGNCNTGLRCQEQPTRRTNVLFGTIALKVVGMCIDISASGSSG